MLRQVRLEEQFLEREGDIVFREKMNVITKGTEKEMASHSSSLAWEIPWTEEPDGIQSMGSQKSPTRLSD